METTISNGTIQCPKHGDLTGFDCTNLQDSSCSDCFIYMAMKEQSMDDSDFFEKDVKITESNKTIQ